MSGLMRLTLLPTATAILFMATGCGLVLGRGAEAPADPAPAAAGDCVPVEIDASTESLWAEVLVRFIQPQQIPDACVLIRTQECYQDPPAAVLDRLREKDQRLRAFSFRCQTGVPTISLQDERGSGGRTITVGDGFKVSCTWKVRRRWFPWQARLKAVGCRG
jgi:hypothetical protein